MLPKLFYDDIEHPHASNSLATMRAEASWVFGGAEGEAEWRLGHDWISSLKLVM